MGETTVAKKGGPRTAAGKAKSARNAMRHGLSAKLLLLASDEAQDFRDLHDALMVQLQPLNPIAKELAEAIAFSLLRMRHINAAYLYDAREDQPVDVTGMQQFLRLKDSPPDYYGDPAKEPSHELGELAARMYRMLRELADGQAHGDLQELKKEILRDLLPLKSYLDAYEHGLRYESMMPSQVPSYTRDDVVRWWARDMLNALRPVLFWHRNREAVATARAAQRDRNLLQAAQERERYTVSAQRELARQMDLFERANRPAFNVLDLDLEP